MKLWTIQHRAAYDKFMKTGFLRADENHLFCKDDLRFAYDWMAAKMVQRFGNPPNNVRYPVWLWYQWEGCRKRPDMRTFVRGWAAKGTPITLITVEIPDHMVLLSDFDMWHIVLNDEYLSLTEEEDEHSILTKEKSNLLPHQEETRLIGIYGRMRLRYLKNTAGSSKPIC